MSASILLIGILGGTSAYAQRKPLDEALKRLDDNYKNLSTVRANVTMDRYESQLGDHDVSEGSVMLLPLKGRDPAFRADWVKPGNESLSVVNGEYIIWRANIRQAIHGLVKKATNNASAGNAFSFMSMSKEQLKTNYQPDYVELENLNGGKPAWHIRLTPRKAADFKVADIWVDVDGMPVQTKVTRKNGDSTTILLTNIKKTFR
ncbi:MAG: outer membrane lipoprotein carrier protein LolA [Acidobacteriota bacterium]